MGNSGAVAVLLISFFVRRNLTDVPPTRDLTRLFMDFISRIEQNELTGDEIKKQLQAVENHPQPGCGRCHPVQCLYVCKSDAQRIGQ